jgi:ABC-2 type transport system ATP-binding protein
MDDPAIKVEHLSKTFRLPHEKQNSIKGALIGVLRGGKRTYEKQQVLKDVSFEVQKGEFFGIVGRNGSGKSTMLKLLAGIYSPTKGILQVNGNLTPFIELGVGFNPELSGRENVFLNGALLGFSRKDMRVMYDDIVAFAELGKFMDQKLKNYSSGMQVRLAFSIAVQARSDILLLDEVLAVGDAAFQRKCFDYFRELKKNGQTVVFISHDMNAVREYCDRAMFIESGEVVAIGSPDEIAQDYIKLFINTEDSVVSGDGARWGNGKAHMQNVTVKGQRADELSVEFDCVFKEAAKEPIIGFIIHSPTGMKLAETNTLWSKIPMGSYKAGETIHVSWKMPNIFTNGQNTVSLTLAKHDVSEYFDWWEEAAIFTIEKPEVTTAVALPKQTIVIRKKK